MQKSKKVVLISFYDKISISMRVLSTIIKDAHHEAFLFYVKDDRTVTIEKFSKTNNYYQFIRHNDFIGCGPDVNPILEEELQVLVESIQEINPDVIGFSSRSVSMDLCEKIVSYLRPILPSARYIAGGYGPTIEPLKFLKFVDYVCLGEGENSILPLIEEDDPNNIPNAAWIENGRMVNSPLSAGVDLNDSSIPDWDLNNKFLIEDCKSTPIAPPVSG